MQRHEFEAVDDDAAINFARDEHSGITCELWCGVRKVAQLPAKGAPAYARPAA